MAAVPPVQILSMIERIIEKNNFIFSVHVLAT
jgi:hypothetical protein